jgi:hypothetical protein
MKRRLLLAAAALSLPCCMTSCGSQFTTQDLSRTLTGAALGALNGAYAESNAIVLEKSAKATRKVLP